MLNPSPIELEVKDTANTVRSLSISTDIQKLIMRIGSEHDFTTKDINLPNCQLYISIKQHFRNTCIRRICLPVDTIFDRFAFSFKTLL